MEGKVLKSTGSWYKVLAMDDIVYSSRLRGKFKQDDKKITNPIAVGDKVSIKIEDEDQKTAIIQEISPRKNYVIRQSPRKRGHGHILAANIDQAVLIATLKQPRTPMGFIDRFLVSAETFRIPGVIIFNKKDLLDKRLQKKQDEFLAIYKEAGYKTTSISALDKNEIARALQLLEGKTSLLSGLSGTGKSTIINQINPDINIKTAEISRLSKKGVHTTTYAEMFPVDDEGTFIIDTPGIKELGLWEVEKEELHHYFPEMRTFLNKCRYHNCTHTHEPGCAVKEAVEENKIAPARYKSYLNMLGE